MRKSLLLCSLGLALAVPAAAAAGDLKLTIGGGRVTLIADQVPVRTVLQEWARLGQIKIVNGDKVQGAPLTLRLIDVPEDVALDIVLRSASGYLAAPRETQIANASLFDRVVILATSRPTASAAAVLPTQPQLQPQPFPSNPVQPPVADEDEEEPNDPANPQNAPPQMPVTSGRPGPIQVSPVNPNAVQPPGSDQQAPAPFTSPRPGLIQPPPQPQQPQPTTRPIP